jgi:adenosine deaminase
VRSFPALLLLCLLTAACRTAGPAPVLAPAGQMGCSEARSIDEAFQCARRDPNALRELVLAMPKGGDLHHHLTGAIYPEVLIQLASYQGLCIDLSPDGSGSPKFAFQNCSTPPAGQTPAGGNIPLAALTADCKACPASQAAACTGSVFVPACCLCSSTALYDGAVNALSMRGVPWGTLQAHDHFFAIFGKLGPATGNKAALMAQLRQQASRENVLYIETMSSVPYLPNEPSWKAFQDLFADGSGSDGAAFCRQLQAGPVEPDASGRKVLAAGEAVAKRAAEIMAAEIADSSRLLGCDGKPDAPGCEVVVGRQIETHRTSSLVNICQEALLGFAASQADRQHIVGINIVAAEDAYVARVDYSAHMNLLGNLGRVYPLAGRALHAGELIEGLVPPNDLRFHVGDAVRVAGAQRIGHGVAITYETRSGDLLREMAAKPVAVEINLVSNAQLLGVEGAEHPLPLYVERGVPVVLATDDPGIMRTSLTEQFRLAARDYPHFRYADLRTFNRNSLEYSFLTGASIWEDPGAYRHPVADCRAALGGLDLDRCAKWVERQGDKARVQTLLERRLRAFEEGYHR